MSTTTLTSIRDWLRREDGEEQDDAGARRRRRAAVHGPDGEG